MQGGRGRNGIREYRVGPVPKRRCTALSARPMPRLLLLLLFPPISSTVQARKIDNGKAVRGRPRERKKRGFLQFRSFLIPPPPFYLQREVTEKRGGGGEGRPTSSSFLSLFPRVCGVKGPWACSSLILLDPARILSSHRSLLQSIEIKMKMIE